MDTLGDARDLRNGRPGDTFYKQLQQGGNAYAAFEKARQAQIQNVARVASDANDYREMLGGNLDAKSRVMMNLMRTQDNPNLQSVTGGFGDIQDMNFRQTAFDSLQPELGAGQAALAAANGKPLVRNTVQGGIQIDPLIAGAEGIPTASTTAAIDLQRERIETEDARQGELGSRTRLANVRADGGGYSPKRSPMQVRAGTIEDDMAAVEQQIGRPLSKQERVQYLTTGKINVSVTDSSPLPAEGLPDVGVAQRKMPGVIGGSRSDGKGAIASPKSKAARDALPKGTRYLDPAGKVRVKS